MSHQVRSSRVTRAFNAVCVAPQVERPRRESTTRNRRLSVVNAEENAEDDEVRHLEATDDNHPDRTRALF